MRLGILWLTISKNMPIAYIPPEEYEEKRSKYVHAQPFTKESLLYPGVV